MDRQERIDLVCRIADENNIDRVEFLGGGFAESGINLDRWERYGTWPDVSFGAFHQTVAYADEGDHSASAENIEFIKNLYFDMEHAARVAAKKYLYWRHDPDVSPLQAWSGYNGSVWGYKNYLTGPNRGNYEQALQKAAEELGAAPASPPARTYGPDVPDSVVLQEDDWSCSVRSSYAALWVLNQTEGHPLPSYAEWQGVMVPRYANGNVGLLDASGAGLVQALATQGLSAGNQGVVTLQQVQARAGKQPVMIGGRNYNHWVYVRGVEDDGTLILENPSPGFKNIRFQLLDSFGPLGPFSMVWVDVAATPVPAPPTPPTPPSEFQFQFGFRTLADELGGAAGTPTEAEHGLDERFNIQRTTTGIMIYSKVHNESSFKRG